MCRASPTGSPGLLDLIERAEPVPTIWSLITRRGTERHRAGKEMADPLGGCGCFTVDRSQTPGAWCPAAPTTRGARFAPRVND
jgi:hypothetical protein